MSQGIQGQGVLGEAGSGGPAWGVGVGGCLPYNENNDDIQCMTAWGDRLPVSRSPKTMTCAAWETYPKYSTPERRQKISLSCQGFPNRTFQIWLESVLFSGPTWSDHVLYVVPDQYETSLFQRKMGWPEYHGQNAQTNWQIKRIQSACSPKTAGHKEWITLIFVTASRQVAPSLLFEPDRGSQFVLSNH